MAAYSLHSFAHDFFVKFPVGWTFFPVEMVSTLWLCFLSMFVTFTL